ncbi:hypothetical protein BEN47_17760 [Hymenobacter lapidarius]|uniref:Uncharacterized protein n=1 Tax=Hymenobacter lapidarius TaxID=1908237 RepID=A0A1G1SX54_9BACT|nr:hypothetical protein [Hymenobacter lapidarius]OGX83184.1 hypothetical protein BEN47_17760 [Hymenobacter lapidarius]
MLPYLIELLALPLAGLAACYGLGTVLLWVSGLQAEEPFFTIFLRLLTGLLMLVVSYALVRTGGVSILLPVPLLLGGVVLALRRPAAGATPAPARLGPALGLTLVLCLAVFAGQYALVYEPGTAHLQTPFQDYVYYSRLTLMLNQFGLETNSLEVVFPQFQTVQPYHYLEIWLNALLVWVSGLPSVWVLFVSMTTMLLTIAGVGFAAIYAWCGVKAAWAMLLGGLMLTVNGTIWPFLEGFLFVGNGSLLSHLPAQLHPKLGPVYIAMVLSGLLLLRQRWVAAALALPMLPLLFVATAPAALAGVVGLVLYLGLSRQLPWQRALLLLAPVGAVGVYMGLFYALQPAPYQFPHAGHSSLLASVLPAGQELETLINIAIGVLLNYGIYYVGYAALAGLLWWTGSARTPLIAPAGWPWMAWAAATLLGALLMRTLSHHFLDGFQFFSNPMVPLSAVVLAIVLGQVLRGQATARLALAAAGLLGLLLVNTLPRITDNARFSTQFLARVGPVLQALPARGGYLLGDADYQNAYMLASDAYTAGTYVSNFRNDYLLLSLSALVPDSLNTDPRFARDSTQAALATDQSTLARLTQLRQRVGRPLSPDSAALALVQRAGLRFICASPRARLPPTLRPLVHARYRDSRSGEVLYVLRPSVFAVPPQLP